MRKATPSPRTAAAPGTPASSNPPANASGHSTNDAAHCTFTANTSATATRAAMPAALWPRVMRRLPIFRLPVSWLPRRRLPMSCILPSPCPQLAEPPAARRLPQVEAAGRTQLADLRAPPAARPPALASCKLPAVRRRSLPLPQVRRVNVAQIRLMCQKTVALVSEAAPVDRCFARSFAETQVTRSSEDDHRSLCLPKRPFFDTCAQITLQGRGPRMLRAVREPRFLQPRACQQSPARRKPICRVPSCESSCCGSASRGLAAMGCQNACTVECSAFDAACVDEGYTACRPSAERKRP